MLNFRQQQGQTLIIIAAVILLILTVVAVNATSLVELQQKKQPVLLQTKQSFYAAEGILEDTLLRVIDPNLSYSTLSPITINNAVASATITQSGNTLTINTTADKNNHIRKLQSALTANTTGASFNYGMQAGLGGFQMKNNSQIIGNVYANSDVIGINNALITGDVWAAASSTISGFSSASGKIGRDAHAYTISGNIIDGSAYGYNIDGSTIGGNAYAYAITNSVIGGNAYYTTISGSTVGGTLNPGYPGSPDPPTQPLPISQTQIDAWKAEAAAGGTISTYTLNGTDSLGPIKITGDLTVTGNGSQLTLTGTIWVTGNVTFQNSGVAQLASSYGSNSGILIADGVINLQNDFIVCGSEGNNGSGSCNASNGSYVLVLSTNTGNPAIEFQNNSTVNAILYAANGTLLIKNNAVLKEAVGYRIEIQNNAQVIYESGLINVNFSSGPGGGWDILSWKEI